jgi:hypothetical protein
VCGLLKGRGREEVAGEHVIMGASTAGERGREVRDVEGADGWGLRGRERAHACGEETTSTDRPNRAARERERERGHAGWHRQAGPACQAPRARWDRPNGPTWAELVFYFPGNF